MDKNIQKAIRHLPEYTAPDRIWNAIEDKLETISVNSAHDTSSLPFFKAPERIWYGVSEELEKTAIKPIWRRKRFLSVAAGIAALLCLGIFLTPRLLHRDETSISYSVEMEIQTETQSMEVGDNSNLGLTELFAHCETSPEICSSPRFKDLKSQLNEVKAEMEKLEDMINSDADPQLQKFYYRLENERADIEKNIIKLFV